MFKYQLPILISKIIFYIIILISYVVYIFSSGLLFIFVDSQLIAVFH